MKYFVCALMTLGIWALPGCGGGGGGGGSGSGTVIEGVIRFQKPGINGATGLDYANFIVRPVRGATIRLINAGDASVIASASTTATGAYSFDTGGVASVRLLILSETTTPAIRVEDNTSGNVLYGVTTTDQAVAGTTTFDFTIPMGWTGAAYDPATRLSGPFNLLDLAYEAVADIQAARPAASFPPCVMNWSPNNVGVPGDVNVGNISTSHYNPGSNEVFILGKENTDTDEFDNHVVVHEWGHWFESNMARSDSIGGNHGGGDRLDMRVAFGEGFGTALAGMILAPDANYVDTGGATQSSLFVVTDLESNVVTNPGWFSEGSVYSLLYDLFDAANDGSDTISLGIGPIYDTMVIGQKNTQFLTSIFTFINYLKTSAGLGAADIAAIDALCTSQSITPVADERGSTETNNGGNVNNLPVYEQVAVGGGPQSGANRPMVPLAGGGNANKLGSNRYSYVVADGAALVLRYGANDDIAAFAFKRGVQVGFADAVNGFGLEFINLATTVNGDVYVAVFADRTFTAVNYNVQLVTNP